MVRRARPGEELDVHPAAVADAYAIWTDAPAREEGRCFAAYAAALEREEAAARSYADMLRHGERLRHAGKPVR